ncbi:hypothetical protein BDDG_12682 [Blastomyces dermatitidis ATCC 18188]|uniref:Uncharacterized protein n=1 Tax=Ajellomyces dermatitidis (strain ATCC 18188 / CBS 674.68) TaxID=653446 RepID=A0A0J9EPN2_AJEDA|nr:hypothetical protein BDDG_12682 [Blastomyces dermatitidis ATCC 18188]
MCEHDFILYSIQNHCAEANIKKCLGDGKRGKTPVLTEVSLGVSPNGNEYKHESWIDKWRATELFNFALLMRNPHGLHLYSTAGSILRTGQPVKLSGSFKSDREEEKASCRRFRASHGIRDPLCVDNV